MTRRASGMRYAALVAWSLGLSVLCGIGLAATGRLSLAGIHWLRDVLGYGHFALAYIFTWRLARRQLGGPAALFAYLAVFAAVVALYAAAHRWWFTREADYVFLMALFLTHHTANEILFREQSRNGYHPFDWTARRVSWVVLAVALVFVDRLGSPAHPWHAAQPALAAVWLASWIGYGLEWIRREWRRPASLGGWLLAGLFGIWCAFHPTERLVFTSLHRFGWIIIYHYLAWYVFYTGKLLGRTGGWFAPLPAQRSPAALWTYATTIPAGFLLLVVLGNLLITGLYMAGEPLGRAVTQSTGLDFFHLNTVAHILFGVGLPARARAAAPAARASAEPLPQFA